MIGCERRLRRVLEKLLRYPQPLISDGAGGYKSADGVKPVIILPTRLARLAISRGLLVACEEGRVETCAATSSWVQRTQSNNNDPISHINPFVAQHCKMEEREIFDESGEMIVVQVNVAQSPLLWLFRQKDERGERFLAPSEFAAGERLRQDYAASAMGRISSSDWTRVRQSHRIFASSCTSDATNLMGLDARRRVMSALQSVGPVLDRLLFSTLIREQGLSLQEKERHWPKSSAKIVLRIALSRLADHYGILGKH